MLPNTQSLAPNNPHKILVVDDDKLYRNLINQEFSSSYEIIEATDGEQGLKQLNSSKPHLVLLDVEMPGLNGYEICDKIKLNPSTSDIPIIFLSTRNSIRQRLQGYEAGADDFLTKPHNKDILQAKIEKLIHSTVNLQKLKEEMKSATETANVALTSQGQLGLAIRYVEKINEMDDYELIANYLFNLSESLELNCCILIDSKHGQFFYSSSGELKPIEKDLMHLLHKENRIYDFGCRTQFNFQNISLLVKNMPINNMEKYGNIKDLISFILSLTSSRIHSVDSDKLLALQANNLSKSVEKINITLNNLIASLQDNQLTVSDIMKQLLHELEVKLPSMGLETDQETFLIGIIDNAVMESIKCLDSVDELKTSFKAVTRLLVHVSDQQCRMMKEAFSVDLEAADNDYIESDIQLF